MDHQPIRRQELLQSPVLAGMERLRRAPGPAAWSPDGRLAFYWAEHLELQLWVFDPRTAQCQPWTSPPFRAAAGQRSLIDRLYTGQPAWSPDGRRIAVAGGGDDDLPANIWLVDGPGRATRLTTGPGQHRNPTWSPDGRQLAFVSCRDGRDDIWTIPADGGTALQLTWNRFDDFDPRWSPDGTLLAFTSARSEDDPLCCQICLLDLRTGQVEVLTEGGRIHNRFPRWSPDGRGLYFLSDRSGFDEVWHLSLDTRRTRMVTLPAGQDKGQFDLSPDGRALAYVQVRRCNHDVEVLDLATAGVRRLNRRDGLHLWPAWSPDGGRIVLRDEGCDRPPELIVHGAADGGCLAHTTCSRPFEPADGTEPVRTEQVSFAGCGGRTIDALLYAAGDRGTAGGDPAIVYIHGGPNGQHSNGWFPFLQHLAAQGYVILAPNCGGSTGYGRAFMDSNIGDWGGDDREDWLGAVRFLRTLDYVDGDRIGVWGRSYGGYATVRALSRHPEVFRAGVCHFGPVDLTSFFDETSVRQLMIHFLGLPRQNAELYRRCSPSEELDRVQAPLLVLQGDRDDGVPQSQSELLVSRLRAQGNTVYYQCYEGEGHGFDRAEHIHDAAGRIAAFWRRHLRGD